MNATLSLEIRGSSTRGHSVKALMPVERSGFKSEGGRESWEHF